MAQVSKGTVGGEEEKGRRETTHGKPLANSTVVSSPVGQPRHDRIGDSFDTLRQSVQPALDARQVMPDLLLELLNDSLDCDKVPLRMGACHWHIGAVHVVSRAARRVASASRMGRRCTTTTRAGSFSAHGSRQVRLMRREPRGISGPKGCLLVCRPFGKSSAPNWLLGTLEPFNASRRQEQRLPRPHESNIDAPSASTPQGYQSNTDTPDCETPRPLCRGYKGPIHTHRQRRPRCLWVGGG
jgi:hypothetical protein